MDQLAPPHSTRAATRLAAPPILLALTLTLMLTLACAPAPEDAPPDGPSVETDAQTLSTSGEGSPTRTTPKEGDAPAHLLLTLRYDGQALEQVDARALPVALRASRGYSAARPGWHLTTFDAAGATTHRDHLTDPTILRAPMGTGGEAEAEVTAPMPVTFTVRVPSNTRRLSLDSVARSGDRLAVSGIDIEEVTR